MKAEPVLRPEAILDFWFTEIEPAAWWSKDPALDAAIRERFGSMHSRAARGELFGWRGSAAGRLAEIIVLDQFSRNIFRDTAAAFACDALALMLAQTAVESGADRQLSTAQRNFVYMPYMHSESLIIHDVALTLFERNGDSSTIDFERRHRAIIERFGRYPHRNDLLGRTSSNDELEFLREPGSSF